MPTITHASRLPDGGLRVVVTETRELLLPANEAVRGGRLKPLAELKALLAAELAKQKGAEHARD